MEDQYIDEEEIKKDSKRDEYLKKYQGIVFSFENMCIDTSLEVFRTEDTTRVQTYNSYFKNNYMRLSAMTSQNLFEIRNKRFE